jgi:hypothetical protein
MSETSSPSPSPKEQELQTQSVDIGLGDIIQIVAPTNSTIHDQIYLIIYIDDQKIKLINASNASRLVLTMSPSGGFTDESITGINLLDSPEHPEYARQNDLLPGKWIDIRFGGDLPTIITGQITNLENDRIEIKAYPGEQVFYIDFEYKGIPENIPIEEIRIRSPPTTIEEEKGKAFVTSLASASASAASAAAAPNVEQDTSARQQEEVGVEPISISRIRKSPSSPGAAGEAVAQPPVEEIQTALKEILFDADSIVFGEELEPIVQFVELPEEQKRYSIESQTSDLLNELVSKYPNSERTKSVLNNIHTIIERFQQLRDEFSNFDVNGNALIPERRLEHYKPLAKSLVALNQKLFWLLPVAKNIRKFYNVESSNVSDFTLNNMEESLEETNALFEDYASNKDSFLSYISKMSAYITPFTTPETATTQFIQTNISAVLDNLNDFYSSIVRGDKIKRNRFVIQTYNMGLTHLQIRKGISYGRKTSEIVEVIPITRNDKINITSYLSLPEPAMNFSNISLPNTNIMRRADVNRHFVPYWNLLRKNTSITQKTIELEERESRSQYSSDELATLASSFVSFVADQDIDSDEKYRKFIEMFVPNTELLIDVMSKYATGSITLSNYVAVLQPFMVYMRDLTTRQYSLFASMIEQKVLEYKKILVQTAREYAALSSAKYAAKYAASSSLYNLLKDSRQVDFETDILSIYGLAPENYKNVDNRQQNTPSRSAGAVAGGGVGASSRAEALGPPPPSKTEFEYDISSFAKTPIERAIAMSAKKVQAKNDGELDSEEFDDVIAVYNEVKKSFPDDFQEMIRMRDDKSLVQSEIIYPIVVAMVKADSEHKRMKQQLERREISAAKSISSIFPDVSFTNSEILYRLICIDNARLYMNTMALINEDLVTPFDFDQLYAQEKKKYEDRMEDNHTKNECKNFVLAKKYNDALEMRDDEDVEVHYDKVYDFTDYGFLKKLENERKNYSPPDFETFLTSRYMKKTKLPMHDAKSEIRDMLRGKRLVQDGQYAVLVIDDEEGVGGAGVGGAEGEEGGEEGGAASGTRYEYFIRNNGKWVKDDTIPSSTSMYDTSYFCNVKSNCFAVNKKCMTSDLAEDALKDDIITKMYDEFDSRFHQSRKQILDAVYRKYNYSLDNIVKMMSIRRYNTYKYNDKQYLSGIDVDPSSKERVSPYARIFDLILGQTDYVKRQKNIMRFIQKFTRKAIEVSTSMSLSVENESPYWLYCKETNTKLVPSFFETIASVFLNQGDIMLAIDTICKERGSISEDGDAWTDKYSGYVIKQIDMDTDEGYDAAGYKLQSRDVIEKSVGETLIQSIKDTKIPTFKNPDAQMVSGILTTMTKYMGIDLESQRVFIVESAMRFLYSSSFPKEEAYNASSQSQASASSSRKMSYKTFKNMTILVLTLAYLIVSIQVSIPPIKTKKTFPGCIRSFVGYPIDGDGDNSSLKYVACIAFKIKTGVEPWDTLSILKTEEKLVKQIQSLISSCVLKNSTYQTRIAEKREYNKINVSEELPAVHDIRNWITFLPPLSRIKIRTPEPLSPAFKNSLQEEFSRGQRSQVEKISAIKSKIIYYSLAIQMMVQNVVDRENLILTSASNEPFVENACCNPEGSVNTIQYFVNSEPLISDYEAKVRQLRDIMHDITDMQKSVTLLDPTNTRTKYPEIPASFQEDTIYLAFITYCKFNSDIPVPENIQHLCHNKPPASLYDKNNSDEPIKNIVAKLKSSGEYLYTEESLHALLDIVNREHIIPFDFSKKDISYAQQIRDLIQACQSQAPGKCDVPEIFMQKVLTIMDTYDYNIKITEDTQELRELVNYLAETNGAMVGEIMQFLNEQKRMDSKTQARFVDFLTNPATFRKMGVGDGILCPRRDTATYKGMQFVLNQMRNLVEVYPNLILNNIDYKKISVPKHWGLSPVHIRDIQNIIKVYYSRLDKFLKDKDSILKDVMKNIQKSAQDWLRFATYTPLYARVIDIVDFGVDGEDVEFDLIEADIARGGPGRGRGSARGQGGLIIQSILESSRADASASSRRKQRGEESSAATGIGPMEVSGEIAVRGQYSIFNDELIRYMFAHYLLNVLMKYITLAKSPQIVVEEVPVPEGMEQDLMSVLEAQDEQNGVGLLSEMSMVTAENVELKKVVAELLGVFINMMISDKAAINVNKKSIKEDITQSKDKEKDIITRELRDMQQDERQMENLMKKLRIGDWNVGGTKGLRFYVPETYEQEREAMESEFQREEALAKQENRIKKNDKVTQRMRDVFTTEQEENMQQEALVDAEIEDDFRLQGDDDEYGADDDGEFNPRDGGFGGEYE